MQEIQVIETVDATLVDGDKPVTPPRVNNTSLDRLDEGVTRLEEFEAQYQCNSAADYEMGAKVVKNGRKLKTLYAQIHKPMKAWWKSRWDEACNDESSRVDRIDAADKGIESKMLAWKNAEDKAKAEREKQEAALQKKRAEDARLQQAQQVADHAKATNNPQLEQAALKMLDKPLDIVPTRVASTVPTLSGTGVHTVKRKTLVAARRYDVLAKQADSQNRLMTPDEWEQATTIAGGDFEDLVISIAASLLLQREPLDVGVKEFLKPLASSLPEPLRALKPAGVDSKWIKSEFAYHGERFKLGGVKVVLKEGLG